MTKGPIPVFTGMTDRGPCQLSIKNDIIYQSMRTYELMIILKSDFPHEDEGKKKALFDKLFAEQPIEKMEITDMGKKELAYEINKQTEGVYFLITLTSPAIKVGELEQQVKLQSGVLRYLLTRKG